MKSEKEYEDFIRMAFGHALNKEISRWGDPAKLASTDDFTENNLCRVKVAIGYSMEIYLHEIINSVDLSENEIDRLEKFVCTIVKAKDLGEIHDIIVNFKQSVLDRYYTFKNGKSKIK